MLNKYNSRPFGKEISNIIADAENLYNYDKPNLDDINRLKRRPNRYSLRVGAQFNQPTNFDRVQKIGKIQKVRRQPFFMNQNIPNKVTKRQQYIEECFKYMKNQQLEVKINPLSNQAQISQSIRSQSLGWLIDIHLKMKLFPSTMYLMIGIMDRYLIQKSINQSKIQLLGIACLFIAGKYEEIYNIPQLRYLVSASNPKFSKNEIIDMQSDILNQLSFNIVVDTVYKFFEPIAEISQMTKKNYYLALYILELLILDTKLSSKYKNSILASSAIYLVNKIRKVENIWSEQLQTLTGYEANQLKSCAKELCYLLEYAQNNQKAKIIRRKYSLPEYHEVSKIKLERKQKSS